MLTRLRARPQRTFRKRPRIRRDARSGHSARNSPGRRRCDSWHSGFAPTEMGDCRYRGDGGGVGNLFDFHISKVTVERAPRTRLSLFALTRDRRVLTITCGSRTAGEILFFVRTKKSIPKKSAPDRFAAHTTCGALRSSPTPGARPTRRRHTTPLGLEHGFANTLGF